MKHQSRCEGRRGSVQAGVVKALEVGSFRLKVANWNFPSWKVKSHPWLALPAKTSPNHCPFIRANPLELQILEWFLLKCILGGRRWWLKGSSGTGLYHADPGAILTAPFWVVWLVSDWKSCCLQCCEMKPHSCVCSWAAVPAKRACSSWYQLSYPWNF